MVLRLRCPGCQSSPPSEHSPRPVVVAVVVATVDGAFVAAAVAADAAAVDGSGAVAADVADAGDADDVVVADAAAAAVGADGGG